jgi:leukotriene-A4 hydrolase
VTRPDPHSAFDAAQPRVRHLEWRARLDFEARVVVAEARLSLDRVANERAAAGEGDVIDLDTRELAIEGISDGSGNALRYELTAPHPFLGQRLRIHTAGASQVAVAYRTSPSSPALCWSPAFVYSQCQPTFARALVPLPDSPSSRITYRAEVTAAAHAGRRTLMAATEIARRGDGGDEVTTWEMPHSIAPHLFALASGALTDVALSPRVRLYSADADVDAAAAAPRFAAAESLIAAAEDLFGAYRWGRFDLLLMPRSFPHGGMENPSLTFLSPSLVNADSALAVVAHELAHAWTGNLVSNASLEHFFINEGFTVYAERRILEARFGSAVAERHAALGRRELSRALAAFSSRPELTRLHAPLDGVDPEEALSIVPYEKGYLLLTALERAVGRAALDHFLGELVDHFAFQSITAETLRAFAEPRLDFHAWDAWLTQPMLPPDEPEPSTAKTTAPMTELPDAATLATWRALDWRWFLDGLPRPYAHCAAVAAALDASLLADPDVRAAWLSLAIDSDHPLPPALVDAALVSGRLKELRPIYLALARNPKTRATAAPLYRKHLASYHPTARRQLEQLLRSFNVVVHVANPLGLGRRPS